MFGGSVWIVADYLTGMLSMHGERGQMDEAPVRILCLRK